MSKVWQKIIVGFISGVGLTKIAQVLLAGIYFLLFGTTAFTGTAGLLAATVLLLVPPIVAVLILNRHMSTDLRGLVLGAAIMAIMLLF